MKRKPLLLFAVLVPAIVAYLILFLQEYSPPFQDDYHAIVSFALEYEQQSTWLQKLLVIASHQHNEYKLVFEHVIVAADLHITHHLNFLFLSVLGDLTLLPIGYLLWKTYGRIGLAGFLPISFLFFTLTDWESLNWAMSGLQNIAVILFSLLAVYLLAGSAEQNASRPYLVLACLAGALAAFTSANGFMLAPVGFLMVLHRKTYARALLWSLSFVAPLAAYLYHTYPVPHHPGRFPYISRPLFFPAFLGGAIPIVGLAILLGLGILAILFLAVRSRFDRVNPVACYFSLWILITAAVVSWVRGGERLVVASRYSVYSVLLLIFCYAFLTHYLADRPATVRRAFYRTSLTVAIAFWMAVDVHAWHKLGQRRRMVLTGMELYRANPRVNSPMIDPGVLRAAPGEDAIERGLLTEAIEKGIVTLECNGCRR